MGLREDYEAHRLAEVGEQCSGDWYWQVCAEGEGSDVGPFGPFDSLFDAELNARDHGFGFVESKGMLIYSRGPDLP